jgi:methylmalonyl-CoA mutase cobalamin-binding subunit
MSYFVDRTEGGRATVRDVLFDSEKRLSSVGVPSPSTDASAIVAHVLGVTRSRLLLQDSVDNEQRVRIEALLSQRLSRVPLQHILGVAHFRYLELKVGPGVFIPRPETELIAEAAALETGKKLNLTQVEVIHKEILHPSEGTRVQIKGTVNFDIDIDKLVLPKKEETLPEDEMTNYIKLHEIKVVAGTGGSDEHSVGMREILDIKHGGVEKYGIKYTYLGTSVPIEKFIDAAIEMNASVVMISLIISHDDIHYKNMQKLHDYAVEKGVRDKLILLAGGTQVTPDLAKKYGMNQGFSRGTKGKDVASFIVKKHRETYEN